MAAAVEPSEAQLLAEIRELLDDLDPVPPHLAQDAKFAIATATMEAELARITDAGLLLVRDQDSPRGAATFTSSALTMMIHAEPEPDGSVRLDGWLTISDAIVSAYADPDPVLLASLPAAQQTSADATGRFVLDGLPPGRHVIVVRATGATEHTMLTPPLEL